ncbi:MAG: hypothetical protein V4726_00975 [Verrucomicrobiota bacterium]
MSRAFSFRAAARSWARMLRQHHPKAALSPERAALLRPAVIAHKDFQQLAEALRGQIDALPEQRAAEGGGTAR